MVEMMTKIAVLGPTGTFTEKAAVEYMQKIGIQGKLEYYTTLKKTFEAIGKDCSYGVIPIENTLDGFVQIILDFLTHSELRIIHELVLPIRFGFVANAKQLEEVKTVYTQFKTQNQCLDFLEQFAEKNIITTPSNSASYEQACKGIEGEAAIIPMHNFESELPFPLFLENVADSLDNETRFIVLSKEDTKEFSEKAKYKTLLVIHDDQDRPGLLVDILNVFSKEEINLVSIISRPTKKGLGSYNFFIDVEGCYQRNEKVKVAVERVMKEYKVRVLGSYYRV